jgi:alpha-L-fucosidase
MTDIVEGPFKASMDSLAKYQCPEWFRDAKFGIWAHWGPQAVPMAGDWYARRMYQPGNDGYKWHVEHYGHPAEFGYKDIIPLWKAEKFDPDRLMGLYKKAGAKYFVSMGVHHDNFDLWDSAHNKWNAVKMGPKRDIVKAWQDAARKLGLKFGVSEHLGASFTWFQDSHKADKEGPKAGVPYDGANPQYQDLYHFPAELGDTEWYSKNPRWHQEWFGRISDLVDKYQPDLLYTDGGVPFGNETGLAMIAHLYNADASRHGGKAEAVYTCKQDGENRWIEDMERGVLKGIKSNPWQTDTSIGDWYYNRNWKFRPVSWVIHMLADIVSKNGNLLLNVVQRPDGSLDPEVEAMLGELGSWMEVNGEAIYGTRPWLVYGEGSIRAKGGAFKEDFSYTSRDVRFTMHGGILYAIVLGWPADGKVTIRSLAEVPDGGKITDISLLGSKESPKWSRDGLGLTVMLPAKKLSDAAIVLRISGSGLKPAPVDDRPEPVKAGGDGAFLLSADEAELHGDGIKAENRGGKPNIGYWDDPKDWISWMAAIGKPGRYRIEISAGGPNATAVSVSVGGSEFAVSVPATGSWEKPGTVAVGEAEIGKAGPCAVVVRPKDAGSWKAVNLWSVRLVPAGR